MRNLITLTAVICLSTLVFCTAVVSAGRLQPDPAPALVGAPGLCNGLACFEGIVPGKTSWGEAKVRLASRSAEVTPYVITVQLAPNVIGTLWKFSRGLAPDGVVGTFDVDYAGEVGPTLATLVAEYGPPCMVLLTPSPKYIALIYPPFTAYAITASTSGMRRPSFDKNWRVFDVTINQDRVQCQGKDMQWPRIPWHGFASWHNFRRH